MSRIPTLLLVIVAALAISVSITITHAASPPQMINAIPTTLVYAPGTPVWNPYAPGNLIGTSISYMPLAMYNQFTGVLYPVLAANWTIFPQNKTFIIYLRHDLYWFNGSAVMPFTAWDVYAEFYIGVKAFGWYYPFPNASLVDQEIRVLNNYTIEFIFNEWSPQQPYYILTTEISTPWLVWKPIVDKLKTMNTTQATKYSFNVTKFVAPYWALTPYYVSSISSSCITLNLEPMYYNGVPLLASWLKVFPFSSWSLYSPTFIMWFTGGTQSMTAMMSGKAQYSWVGLSQQQIITVENAGVGVMLTPDFGVGALIINPLIYPFNIPQVRQVFQRSWHCILSCWLMR